MLKKTLKIIGSIFLLFFAIYFIVLSDLNPLFKSEDFVKLRKSLEESRQEDLSSIVSMYNKIHSQDKSRQCECRMTLGMGIGRHGFSLTKVIYFLKINREFTHDDCLKFNFLNADFLYGNIGLKAASKFYFNKTIEQLSEYEKIMFIVMFDNPSLYNPSRRKEKVVNKIILYKNILNAKPAGNSRHCLSAVSQ